MALSADDKKYIKGTWTAVTPHNGEYGAEALTRMFLCFPQTKTYFSHIDCHVNSPQIKAHGKKVMDALTEAVNHLDNITGCMGKLIDLHAFDLRVDPGNFPLLAENILVVIGIHHPDKLDCLTHRALDKFLCAVSGILTSKYR
ncbi:hemoglobin subunit alpha-1-like [Pelodytes ibericus]